VSQPPKPTFRAQPIISEQVSNSRLAVVIRELEHTLDLNVPGAVVEFGCYIGTTSLFIRRSLDSYAQSAVRSFWAYDSFMGLPAKHVADNSTTGSQFIAGELSVTKKQLLQEFHKARLTPPIIHKAWFKDLDDNQLPAEIAFAFLDGDFYDSIKDSLRLVWPRLSPGGTITVDDYQREALPGVERAVTEWMVAKKLSLRQEHNIAIIKKL
jgi:O-methyltransferase